MTDEKGLHSAYTDDRAQVVPVIKHENSFHSSACVNAVFTAVCEDQII